MKSAIHYVNKNQILWLLIALAPASCLWSEIPRVTLLESYVSIFAMSIFSLYFVVSNTRKQQKRLIVLYFLFGVTMNFMLTLAIPSTGIHISGPHAGAWMGIYGHKNALGRNMVLGSIFFFSELFQNPKSKISWFGFASCTLLVLLSTSKTALLVFLIVAAYAFLYRRYRWKGSWTLICISISTLILGCLSILLVNNWVSILISLGRDPTLTGRTYIWSFLIEKLQDQLLLGYGYGAFWAEGSVHLKELAIFLNEYEPAHSHNGLLEIGIGTGLVGMSLFTMTYLIAYLKAAKDAYRMPECGSWNLSFLTLFLLVNLTESTVFGGWTLYWIMYVITVCTVGKCSAHGRKIAYVSA